MANPQSAAKIAGHPVHPMLIPFPIAFFVAAFVCDLVYWRMASDAWATAAIWLIGAGIVMAVLAAVVGLADLLGDRRIRALTDAWWHAGAIAVVALIELYNWYIRYTLGASAVVATGLVLSLIVVCILLFAGWKGWEMVYRYRVGVAEEPETLAKPAAQPRRAA